MILLHRLVERERRGIQGAVVSGVLKIRNGISMEQRLIPFERRPAKLGSVPVLLQAVARSAAAQLDVKEQGQS